MFLTYQEKQNKMNKQTISAALNHTFHVSSRLLQALIHHSQVLFPDVTIFKYIPPLGSGVQLPEKPNLMDIELKKQESLLTQIHKEMNCGCISKEREELLWEVQRIITQLKRKLKTTQKDKNISEKSEEKSSLGASREMESNPENDDSVDGSTSAQTGSAEMSVSKSDNSSIKSYSLTTTIEGEASYFDQLKDDQEQEKTDNSDDEVQIQNKDYLFDDDIVFLTYKRNGLINLKEQLLTDMQAEKREIGILKETFDSTSSSTISNMSIPKQEYLDEVMALLQKENQILQIKKINLVRKITEQKELCIELSAQLKLAFSDTYLTNLKKLPQNSVVSPFLEI